ncbi:MAG: hypothetical protein ACOVMP_09600 [Chthoniobacterales bacterium]
MPIYKTNPLDSAFRYMWIGFTGLFVSAIGLGFAIHDTTKPILNDLSLNTNRSPELVKSLLADALMSPLPIITGAMSLFFLILFAASGALFLVRSIALLAKNDEGH